MNDEPGRAAYEAYFRDGARWQETPPSVRAAWANVEDVVARKLAAKIRNMADATDTYVLATDAADLIDPDES